MSHVITISNVLSLLRVPLAFAFLVDIPWVRCLVIGLVMVTDCLDGYLARRFGQTSQFGAVLDPLMDKFFALFALGICLVEGSLGLWQICAMICRDFAIILFGIYLVLQGLWARYQFRSIWCGKVTTVGQCFVLMAVCLGYAIPNVVFAGFVALGVFAIIELYLMAKPAST